MTDHYSEAREWHEERLLKERAALAKRSAADQKEYENVFIPARRIAREEKKRQQAVRIYHELSWKYED